MQVEEVMAPALNLPDWVISALAFFLILGLPVALVLAWAFELTPDGIRREGTADENAGDARGSNRRFYASMLALLGLVSSTHRATSLRPD